MVQIISIYSLFFTVPRPKKARTVDPSSPGSGLKPLPRTPWDWALKYDVRGRIQLKWELWLTEYFFWLGLPWSMLDHPAHKEFWAKYHCKHSTAYSRAKLPLLYNQVKNAVDSKIIKKFLTLLELHSLHITGHQGEWIRTLEWLHMIGKNWTLNR